MFVRPFTHFDSPPCPNGGGFDRDFPQLDAEEWRDLVGASRLAITVMILIS
jgi:hypothetical protein